MLYANSIELAVSAISMVNTHYVLKRQLSDFKLSSAPVSQGTLGIPGVNLSVLDK